MPRNHLHLLPELGLSTSPTTSLRIPEGRNITLTPRVIEIIDHPAFQRLRRIRMLGPTHFVYPGAVHTRFEHSLGVFGCVQWYLLQLLRNSAFANTATEQDLLTVLAAGLLHDIGHYPFAHSLEALHLKGRDAPRHEEVGGRIIHGQFKHLRGTKSLADILRKHWNVDPDRVISLCTGKLGPNSDQIDSILHSIISSTIDADKMDYLDRDSHHIGVPYGRNYDRDRLLASLTLNAQETSIALNSKGKIPAEMFIFSRYTMFSEVYWHHTVRAASAMVESSIAAFHSRSNIAPDDLLNALLQSSDDDFLSWMCTQTPKNSGSHYLIAGLLNDRRLLYKRIATFSRVYAETDKQKAYELIYNMQANALYDLTARITARLSSMVNRTLHPADIIIDIPPRDKDRLESIEIVFSNAPGRRHYHLHELSRIVAGIQNDFIAVVKKIRIFAHPQLAAALHGRHELETVLMKEILRS